VERSGSAAQDDATGHEPTVPSNGVRRPRTTSPSLPAGAKLIRIWRGRTHEVTVVQGGKAFVYQGKTYRSLSSIATEITGMVWSGPQFFGVVNRKGKRTTRGSTSGKEGAIDMSRPSSSLSGGTGVPGRTGDTAGSVRCAIYTRKSSEEGLDMLFNSLDAQREAGMDYIKSQRSQGWVAVPALYDDGGFSGGNTERPGLQRLLTDIKAQRIDIVVVYKVDRLSRSLNDFARLMQVFDEHRVSFVSVTQQFNTTTSMGRLTLNMLLSFAQFEREVTGERIRDKIAATMRKGIFTVGRPPFGYRRPVPSDPDPGNRVIRIVPDEADVVRRVYALYLEHRSPLAVIEALRAEGIPHRLRQCDTGLNVGKLVWSTGHIHYMLTNATYAGKIVHTRGANLPEGKGRCPTDIWPGLHEPIIDPEVWDRVQALINRRERAPATRWSHTHLLKGKLRTNEGSTMTPSNSMKRLADGGCRRVPYYVSMKACTQGRGSCPSAESTLACSTPSCARWCWIAWNRLTGCSWAMSNPRSAISGSAR
jgi:DNA invertase Pin-like site-specific DNA recombinase